MARTIRTIRTIADVQDRAARVGRIERLDERTHIAQSIADAEATTVEAESLFGPPLVYTTQTPTPLGVRMDGMLDRLSQDALRQNVHDDVIAIGQRAEYERACAAHDYASSPERKLIEMVFDALTGTQRSDFVLVNG